jgi:RNA polymerase sigma factor (sigma-70 family)
LATLAAPGISATARSRPDVTDHDLVQAVRAGDDHAFERLYGRYHRRISAYIFGMVHDHGRAEDLTQEVFVSALRRMRQTDRDILFKPWIYEIAKNACIDQFRRTSRTEEVSIDAEDGHGLGPADHGKLHARGQSPDAAVEGKQQLDHLCGAFGGLSDAHHQILVMRELEGLSYREIGERLGMSRPSVESTLFRARRRLTEEFEELRTGERCLRILEVLERAEHAGGRLGLRDQRRVSSHISHCQPCRKHAVMAGVDAGAIARRPVRAKIGAFLPLPAFLKKRWFDGGDPDSVAAHAAGVHGPALAQASMVAAQYGDSTAAGWMKATAVAAAVAVAGVGAGAVQQATGGSNHDAPIVKSGGAAAAGLSSKASAFGSSAGTTGGTQRAIVQTAGSSGTGSSASSSAGTKNASGAGGGTSSAAGGGRGAGTFSSGGPSTGGGSGSAGGSGTGGAATPSASAKDASASSGGSSGSSSSSSPQAAGGTTGAASAAAGTASGAAGAATTTAATTPIIGAAGSPQSGSGAPLVAPNLAPLTQPAAAAPPQSVGQVASGVTDVVGDVAGGQVGGVVKQTGQAVGDTVDQVTTGVTDAAGKLLGGK